MSTLNNDYILEQLAVQGFVQGEEIYLPTGSLTTQQGGYPVKGQLHHITFCNVANASLVMKSIMSNDNPGMVFLINDSANTVVVFPFKAFGTGATDTAETVNGGASFSVTSNNAAVFISSLVQPKRKGGSSGSTPSLNWVAALLS